MLNSASRLLLNIIVAFLSTNVPIYWLRNPQLQSIIEISVIIGTFWHKQFLVSNERSSRLESISHQGKNGLRKKVWVEEKGMGLQKLLESGIGIILSIYLLPVHWMEDKTFVKLATIKDAF